MHNGTDTEFYLKKGFRVVGVEANPHLVEAARVKFHAEIAQRRLVAENVGIHDKESVVKFYVNQDVDEWSSFDINLGTRQGTRYTVIDVLCKPLAYFVGKYGMPYYLKVDVEGLDPTVVRQLSRWVIRPAYISLEDSGIDALIALYESWRQEIQVHKPARDKGLPFADPCSRRPNSRARIRRGIVWAFRSRTPRRLVALRPGVQILRREREATRTAPNKRLVGYPWLV